MLSTYEPKEVMKYFEKICAIPHGSNNMKPISEYLMRFAEEHKLKARCDELYNVIIWKDATDDKKNSEPLILQGHTDMVCVKEEGCTKDMAVEGLDLEVSDGYISAKGTSLGADDGIAVAFNLAILASDEISHPKIAAVFTVNEEIGMFGATDINLSDVEGNILLNIDSEEEGIFLSSCAGGATAECEIPYNKETINGIGFGVVISQLMGGHSGMEIHKGRANANGLLGRFMLELSEKMPFAIASIEGGEKDNAIAKYSKAMFCVQEEDKEEFLQVIEAFKMDIKKEYETAEPDISVNVKELGIGIYEVMDQAGVIKITMALNHIPNGVQKMSADIEGLVQTSLNLGILKTEQDRVSFSYSVRSAVQTEKDYLLLKIKNFIQFLGGNVEVCGNYPAWEYKKNSKIRNVMVDSYRKLFGKEPSIEAVHAGLECGIMAAKREGLDCISFGPDIENIHTTRERVSIESIERTWRLLLDTLKEI